MKAVLCILALMLISGCSMISDEDALSLMKRPIIVVGIHEKSNATGNATVRDSVGNFRLLQGWIGAQISEHYKIGDTLK